MNQIKFIIFPDGSTMRLSEYRAMCLRDAKTLADHGKFMFRMGRYNAAFVACVSIVLSGESAMQGIPILKCAVLTVSVFCIWASFVFRYLAIKKQRECLHRRQWIMDSLSVAEKAFA